MAEKPLLPFNIKVGRLLSLCAVYSVYNALLAGWMAGVCNNTHTRITVFSGKIYNRAHAAAGGAQRTREKSTARRRSL